MAHLNGVVNRPDILEVLVPRPSNCTCSALNEYSDCEVHVHGKPASYEVKAHDPETDGPLSIIVMLDVSSGLWHVFEGSVNPDKRTYKITIPINAFPANTRDSGRIPDQVLRFAWDCSRARGIGLWVP